jgi:hypothetical protein
VQRSMKGRCLYVKRQETPQGENQQAQAEEKKKAEPSQKKDVAGVGASGRMRGLRIQEKGEIVSHPFLFYTLSWSP